MVKKVYASFLTDSAILHDQILFRYACIARNLKSNENARRKCRNSRYNISQRHQPPQPPKMFFSPLTHHNEWSQNSVAGKGSRGDCYALCMRPTSTSLCHIWLCISIGRRLCNSRVAACVTRYTRYKQLRKKNRKSHPEGTFSVCTFRNLYLASALLAVNVGDDEMMGLGYACLFEVGHECRWQKLCLCFCDIAVCDCRNEQESADEESHAPVTSNMSQKKDNLYRRRDVLFEFSCLFRKTTMLFCSSFCYCVMHHHKGWKGKRRQ